MADFLQKTGKIENLKRLKTAGKIEFPEKVPIHRLPLQIGLFISSIPELYFFLEIHGFMPKLLLATVPIIVIFI